MFPFHLTPQTITVNEAIQVIRLAVQRRVVTQLLHCLACPQNSGRALPRCLELTLEDWLAFFSYTSQPRADKDKAVLLHQAEQ